MLIPWAVPRSPQKYRYAGTLYGSKDTCLRLYSSHVKSTIKQGYNWPLFFRKSEQSTQSWLNKCDDSASLTSAVIFFKLITTWPLRHLPASPRTIFCENWPAFPLNLDFTENILIIVIIPEYLPHIYKIHFKSIQKRPVIHQKKRKRQCERQVSTYTRRPRFTYSI